MKINRKASASDKSSSASSSSVVVGPSKGRPSLNDILGKVAVANAVVSKAVECSQGAGRNDRTPPRVGSGLSEVVSGEEEGGGSSSSTKKMSRGGKELELDDKNEIFAMSSDSDDNDDDNAIGGQYRHVIGEEPGASIDVDGEDLGKTLDTWFSRQNKKRPLAMETVARDKDLLSESKIKATRERGEGRSMTVGEEERDWLTDGYEYNTVGGEGGVEVEDHHHLLVKGIVNPPVLVGEEDGEVAEMQCMLADVLIKAKDTGTGRGESDEDNTYDDSFL